MVNTLFLWIYLLFLIGSYLTSSKTTLTDYQCVSTRCCTHVAKAEITIDNQHVTKSLQRYVFLPKQPKENTEKITSLPLVFNFGWLCDAEIPNFATTKICHYWHLYYSRIPVKNSISLSPANYQQIKPVFNYCWLSAY